MLEGFEQRREVRIEQGPHPVALVEIVGAGREHIEQPLRCSRIVRRQHAPRHGAKARFGAVALEVPEVVAQTDEAARIGDRTGINEDGAGNEVRTLRGERHHHLAAIALADEDSAIDGQRRQHLDQVERIDGRDIAGFVGSVGGATAPLEIDQNHRPIVAIDAMEVVRKIREIAHVALIAGHADQRYAPYGEASRDVHRHLLIGWPDSIARHRQGGEAAMIIRK